MLIHVIALLIPLAAAPPAAAQQHVHPTTPAAAAGDQAGTSTLSAEAVKQLLDGEGMGLARAAEMHQYPGPKHLLDRAGELQLTLDQQKAIAQIREDVVEQARRLGRRIVDAERALDAAFRSGAITQADLDARLREIATLQGELRAVHLRAHLRTRPLLTEDQIRRYYQTPRAQDPDPEPR